MRVARADREHLIGPERDALITAADALGEVVSEMRDCCPESSWVAVFSLIRAHLLREAGESPLRVAESPVERR